MENILNILASLAILFLVSNTVDYLIEKYSCKKHYKKESNCKCYTCRFYTKCKFTKLYKEMMEENYDKWNKFNNDIYTK